MEQAPRALNAASHTLLAIVYILPLFYAMPPNANVILTSTLAVFTGCLRTIAPGRDDVERLSQKVRLASQRAKKLAVLCRHCSAAPSVPCPLQRPRGIPSNCGMPHLACVLEDIAGSSWVAEIYASA